MSASRATGPAFAIGKFDALHLGHFALAQRAAAIGEPALLTFPGMARALGWPERPPLVAASDRARVLADWGGHLACGLRSVGVPFDDIKDMEPREFVAFVIREHAAATLVVGEDFRFGRGRSGGVGELRALAGELGCGVEVVAPVCAGGVAISSSRVRAALAAGDAAQAALCLGRPHRLVGTVVRGDGRGRTIGVPTANCGERENQEPASGVYAAFAELGTGVRRPRLAAAVNVGRVPTAGTDRPLTVEAHLIGFSGDCYGSRIALDLVARLRDERRFPDLGALKEQIGRDIAAARSIIDLVQ